MLERKAKPTGTVDYRQIITLTVGALIILAGLLVPVSGGLTRQGLMTLSILLLAICFWSTEVVDSTVTAIIVLVLLPTLGILSYPDTFASLGQHIIWRLVGILIITAALSKSGLDKRISIGMMKLAGGRVYLMLLLMVISAQVLVFIIPAPQARAGLLAAIYLSILRGMGINPPSNLGRIIFLGVPITCVITSAATITGASVQAYAFGLFTSLLHYNFSYTSWMVLNLPMTFVASLLTLLGLIILFPPEIKHLGKADALLSKQLAELGPLNIEEKKILILFGLLMVMWLTNISESMPAELLVAALLFLPGINLLTWKEAEGAVPWSIVILYGASLSLALALQQTKVVAWAVQEVMKYWGSPTPLWAALLVITITVVVRLGMINMTGVVATVFPLVTSLAAVTGLNPVWLGMICVAASSIGFFYPSQNGSILITLGYGYYNGKDMAKAGTMVFVIMTATIAVFALVYWPLVGVKVQP